MKGGKGKLEKEMKAAHLVCNQNKWSKFMILGAFVVLGASYLFFCEETQKEPEDLIQI